MKNRKSTAVGIGCFNQKPCHGDKRETRMVLRPTTDPSRGKDGSAYDGEMWELRCYQCKRVLDRREVINR